MRMSLEGWPDNVPPDIDHESISLSDLTFPILSPQSNIVVQGLIPSDHISEENKYDKMSSTGFNDCIGGGTSSTGNVGNGFPSSTSKASEPLTTTSPMKPMMPSEIVNPKAVLHRPSPLAAGLKQSAASRIASSPRRQAMSTNTKLMQSLSSSYMPGDSPLLFYKGAAESSPTTGFRVPCSVNLSSFSPTCGSPNQSEANPVQSAARTSTNSKPDGYSRQRKEVSAGKKAMEQSVDEGVDDGYEWRKYGQKYVKHGKGLRFYHRCVVKGCTASKKTERDRNGRIVFASYAGEHNHPPPHGKVPKLDVSTLGSSIIETEGNNELIKLSGETANPGKRTRKRRRRMQSTKTKHQQVPNFNYGKNLLVVRRTGSEQDVVLDGYKWRKYGQKCVGGGKYPRSYYKCTARTCQARKHLERSHDDPNVVIVTYEEQHNHSVPYPDKLESDLGAQENANVTRFPRGTATKSKLKSSLKGKELVVQDTTELQIGDNEDIHSLHNNDVHGGQPLPVETSKYRGFERPGALQVAIQQQVDKVTPYGLFDKSNLLDEEFENDNIPTPNTLVGGMSGSLDENTPDELSTLQDLPNLNLFTGLLSSGSKDSIASLIKTPEKVGSR